MHFMLDKEIDQWHQCTEEQTSHNLPVLRRAAVIAKGYAAQRPRQSRNQVRNHEDIVPVMVIR